jgi:hypothetical protein
LTGVEGVPLGGTMSAGLVSSMCRLEPVDISTYVEIDDGTKAKAEPNDWAGVLKDASDEKRAS